MPMTQRVPLTPEDEKRLQTARADFEATKAVHDRYRQVCVEMVQKSSLRVVAELTGLSTNTLQRWKREVDSE